MIIITGTLGDVLLCHRNLSRLTQIDTVQDILQHIICNNYDYACLSNFNLIPSPCGNLLCYAALGPMSSQVCGQKKTV